MPGDDTARAMIGSSGRFICAASNIAGAVRRGDNPIGMRRDSPRAGAHRVRTLKHVEPPNQAKRSCATSTDPIMAAIATNV
jgi:hypothetical protein